MGPVGQGHSGEINGYGNSEKAKSKKAYDFLIQAESGLCSVTGTESNPSKVGISIRDPICLHKKSILLMLR